MENQPLTAGGTRKHYGAAAVTTCMMLVLFLGADRLPTQTVFDSKVQAGQSSQMHSHHNNDGTNAPQYVSDKLLIRMAFVLPGSTTLDKKKGAFMLFAFTGIQQKGVSIKCADGSAAQTLVQVCLVSSVWHVLSVSCPLCVDISTFVHVSMCSRVLQAVE